MFRRAAVHARESLVKPGVGVEAVGQGRVDAAAAPGDFLQGPVEPPLEDIPAHRQPRGPGELPAKMPVGIPRPLRQVPGSEPGL